MTEHPDASSFLAQVEDALERAAAPAALTLSVALRQRASDEPVEGSRFMTVEHEGDVRLAAVLVPPRKLVVHGASADAARAVARHCAAARCELPGVVGAPVAAHAFAEAWRDETAADARVMMRQGVYELREVRHNGDAPGALRDATSADTDLLVDWVLGFVADAGVDETLDAVEARETVARRRARGEIVIWEDEGEPVCTAASARPTSTGVTVNAVYTPPALRGRGYATACVAALTRRLLDAGYVYCTLFTDLANPTSNRIYRRIGYEQVGESVDYAFTPASL